MEPDEDTNDHVQQKSEEKELNGKHDADDANEEQPTSVNGDLEDDLESEVSVIFNGEKVGKEGLKLDGQNGLEDKVKAMSLTEGQEIVVNLGQASRVEEAVETVKEAAEEAAEQDWGGGPEKEAAVGDDEEEEDWGAGSLTYQKRNKSKGIDTTRTDSSHESNNHSSWDSVPQQAPARPHPMQKAKPQEYACKQLSRGFLLLKTRQRITIDGGRSVLATDLHDQWVQQ